LKDKKITFDIRKQNQDQKMLENILFEQMIK